MALGHWLAVVTGGPNSGSSGLRREAIAIRQTLGYRCPLHSIEAFVHFFKLTYPSLHDSRHPYIAAMRAPFTGLALGRSTIWSCWG